MAYLLPFRYPFSAEQDAALSVPVTPVHEEIH